MSTKMKKILKAAWFTPGARGRWGLPILFEGRPGNGKTAISEEVAGEAGLYLKTIIASLREPFDFLGLAVPQKGKLQYLAPDWAQEVADKERAVIFLDEFNTAPPSVQAALLRMVLDGYVGELKLPNTVRFVAAQNAVEESVGGFDLAPPTANRWGHLPWPSVESGNWSDWLLGGGEEGKPDALDAAAEEARVEAAFVEPFARSRGLVAGFIKRRPDLLHKQPAMGSPQASKAWPSPRTWEMAARALAGAQVHGLNDEETDDLVSAFIGQGAAMEFAVWVKQVDLPDPALVLDGKEKWTHDPKRLDRTVALFDSCAALVSPINAEKRLPRAGALWKLLDSMMGEAPDLAVPAARVLVHGRLISMQEARNVLKRIQPILAAAGITAGG